MGEARRKKQRSGMENWPRADNFRGTIDLHLLPPAPSINGSRMRELTGDPRIPDTVQVILKAFRAIVGDRTFHVGFCLGNESGFSAVGSAVIDRLMIEVPESVLHIVQVVYPEIAWDIVLRNLRTFCGQVLLFVFPDSDIYDSGVAEIYYSEVIRVFYTEGQKLDRLTVAQRQKIREQKASSLNRPPPSPFYAMPGAVQEDAPWIFRLATPAGKVIRTAVWNGRRNYAHEFPEDIIQLVGGEKIAIVQVDSPVGINRRSSLDLTHKFAKEFDGIVHWARDTGTFQSILTSFIRLDLEAVGPPELPEDWQPKITIFTANGDVL